MSAVNSNLERFYSYIKYNADTMSANVRGVDILVDIDNDAETSYLDTEHYATTGDWLVHIVNPTKPLKELLFDFYHEAGRIFLKKGFIDTIKPSIWLDKVGCGVSSRKDILIEMACDGYAISEIGYSGNIVKLIPMIKKTTIVEKHRDATAEDIDRCFYNINNDITVRRKYVNWLISENSTLGADAKTMPLKDIINIDISFNKKNTRLSRSAARDLTVEDDIDKSIDSDRPKSKTLMMLNLDKIGISYSTNTEFSRLCDRFIKAITSENVNMRYFNIEDHKYSAVNEEPSDWKKNFIKYYYYDKKLKTYLKYTSKTLVETEIETKDNLIDDIINGKGVSLTETAKSSTDKKKTTTVFPEFAIVKTNVYKKVSVDTIAEAEKIRNTYKTIVKDFIIPWTTKFKDQYRVTDRNETRYVIERILNYYITTKQYPSQEHITELQNDFRGSNIGKTKMNPHVAGLLSYNEKVQIAKKNHKKKKNETVEKYESRIRELVYTNRYNEKA